MDKLSTSNYGPETVLPIQDIALKMLDKTKPSEIAESLGLTRGQVYNAIARIRANPEYQKQIELISEAVRTRLMLGGMQAVDALEKVTALNPGDKAPAALAMVHGAKETLDRIGIASEPRTTIVNVNLNMAV